ncbi:MAG: STAS domain-containing protein [Myxococcales bacterium]
MEFTECASVNGWTVWTIAGRLDTNAAPDLEALLAGAVASGNRSLALDFERVTFLGSAALRVLLLVLKSLRPMGGAVALARAAPQVRGTLEVSHVLWMFALVDQLSELPERLAAPAP